jgi:hypothetical protein
VYRYWRKKLKVLGGMMKRTYSTKEKRPFCFPLEFGQNKIKKIVDCRHENI